MLWAICVRRRWNHADLARHLEVTTAAVTGLAYGDFKPGRKVSDKLRALGVKPELWDKPCPAGWSPPELRGGRREASAIDSDSNG